MDTNIYFENLGYTVSDNNNLLDKEYNISQEALELMDNAYYLSAKGKKSAVKTIQKYIKLFPKIPHFKNYLGVLYTKLATSTKPVK